MSPQDPQKAIEAFIRLNEEGIAKVRKLREAKKLVEANKHMEQLLLDLSANVLKVQAQVGATGANGNDGEDAVTVSEDQPELCEGCLWYKPSTEQIFLCNGQDWKEIAMMGERGPRGEIGLPGRDGRDGESIVGPMGPSGADGVANPAEITDIAQKEIKKHEKSVDHSLIHSPGVLGTKKVDESSIGDDRFLKFDAKTNTIKYQKLIVHKPGEIQQIHGGGMPNQIGQSGKFLTTDGRLASWGNVPAPVTPGTNAKFAVILATNAALSGTYNNGTSGVGATLTFGSQITIDGVGISLGQRILVKNNANTQNGIYTVTQVNPTILTRATDYNTQTLVNYGDSVYVYQGTTNLRTLWFQTFVVASPIGSQNIGFIPPNLTNSLSAGSGISISYSSPNTIITNTGGTFAAGTDKSILFVHPGGTVSQDPTNFIYDQDTGQMAVGTNTFIANERALVQGKVTNLDVMTNLVPTPSPLCSCSDPTYTNQTSCESNGTCTDISWTNQTACEAAGTCGNSWGGSQSSYDNNQSGCESQGLCHNSLGDVSIYDSDNTGTSCVSNGLCSGGGWTDPTSCTASGTCTDTTYNNNQASCESNGLCSDPSFTDQTSCEAQGSCSDPTYTDQATCEGNGDTWTSAGNVWTVNVFTSDGYTWETNTWTFNTFTSEGNVWTPNTWTCSSMDGYPADGSTIDYQWYTYKNINGITYFSVGDASAGPTLPNEPGQYYTISFTWTEASGSPDGYRLVRLINGTGTQSYQDILAGYSQPFIDTDAGWTDTAGVILTPTDIRDRAIIGVGEVQARDVAPVFNLYNTTTDTANMFWKINMYSDYYSENRASITYDDNVGMIFAAGNGYKFHDNMGGTASITDGYWSAGTIQTFYGGTGNTSYTTNALLYYNGSTFVSVPGSTVSSSGGVKITSTNVNNVPLILQVNTNGQGGNLLNFYDQNGILPLALSYFESDGMPTLGNANQGAPGKVRFNSTGGTVTLTVAATTKTGTLTLPGVTGDILATTSVVCFENEVMVLDDEIVTLP